MGRNNHVVLSDEEYEKLAEARKDIFKSDSVPMGEVVMYLLEEEGY